jgi:hypothetical protein
MHFCYHENVFGHELGRVLGLDAEVVAIPFRMRE